MPPRTGFLADISDELRDLLAKAGRGVRLDDGEVLFEEGEEGDALYALREGAIELSVLSAAGRKLSLDVLREGEVFGEIALFDPGPRTATAQAMGATTLIRVRNADLSGALAREPELALDLVRLAGQRMRWMNRQLSEHVFLPMPGRLARKILHLTAHQHGAPRALEMSQAELAEFVGATREAVSKTLAAWKARGVVVPARGGLQIRDLAALEELAELDEG